MRVLEDGQERVRLLSSRVDNWLLRLGNRVAKFLIEYRYLLSVMIIGFIVWAIVFNIAVIDYTNSSNWISRAAWLGPFPGPDTIEIFGFTVEYQLEGYSDYSFYYVHWGHNSLYGVMPYSPDYGVLELNGVTNENGAHMFPPFTSYLYAAGIALGNFMGWEHWGIGFLIAAFGYLTALPVYGVASELASNKRVGEVAALTYLLNPLMLYHTDFLWFNPAPFVFFFFTGFYMLIRGKRLTGTLLIVCAALFKQTAWFLGIPLVVYLLVRPREPKTTDNKVEPQTNESQDGQGEKQTDTLGQIRSGLQPFIDYFDFRNFMVSVVVVLIFVGAIMLPFLIAQPHFWNYWRLALGSFSFEGNFVDLPPYNVPMRLQVLLIGAGMPAAAELLDIILLSGGPLGFGVVLCAGIMILKDKWIGEETLYLRRILFLTLIMMLIVTLLGPRGVFKYYFVMLMPFFSIFSSARMIRGSGEHVPFSASMIWLPITFTLMILIPDRNIYLVYVIIIFICYLLAPVFDKIYHAVKRPFRFIREFVSRKTKILLQPLVVEDQPFDTSRKRFIANIIVQSVSLVLGIVFIILGGLITQLAFYVDIITGLEIILVFSASFIMGFHLLAVAYSMALHSELRLNHLNKRLREFTFMVTAYVWIYSIWTYILSWSIEPNPERQVLVLTSVFLSIWAGSLIVKQGGRIRILTDVLILVGLAAGLNAWSSLTNLSVTLLGTIAFCSVIVHLLLVCVHYFDRGVKSPSADTQPTQVVETSVDHTK